jgi:hypothetical protein
MSEPQGEVRVRNVSTQKRNESILESAVEFGGGLVRTSVSLLMLPIAVLPPESRQHMRNATKELMYAFATLPRDFADIAGTTIEEWASEAEKKDAAHSKKAPHDEVSKAEPAKA